MSPDRAEQTPEETPLEPLPAFWRRLFYRWFVEYNPLYLVSAALVLGGALVLSRGLAEESSLESTIGVAALSELYAASLLGGAALLERIGLRRPAVMLGLLAVLYQWDLTLHAETSVYLGAAGAVSLAVWFALFLAKLHALAWALRLNLSRRFFGVLVGGALGLALGPRVLPSLAPEAAGTLLALWAFGLASSIDRDGVTSLVELDAWGRTVLRRSTRASLALSAGLLALHVFYWASERRLDLALVLPVAPMLLVRRARTELQAFGLVLTALLASLLWMPSALSTTALLAAIALALRAITKVTRVVVRAPESAPRAPYRAGGDEAEVAEVTTATVSAARDPGERARLLASAIVTLYVSIWTLGYTGGAWPAHALAVDLAFATSMALFAWRARARSAVAPIVATGLHFAIETRLLPPPRTRVEWGAVAVSLGFLLLAGSLLVSYRLRARPRATAAV